jgi:squalene cyclase
MEKFMRRSFRILLPLILGPLILLGWMVFLHPGESIAASPASENRNDIEADIELTTVISAALEYVKTQQKPDGGIAGFGLESDPDSTARAILALAAAERPISWMTSISGTTMVEYLANQAITYTHDTSGTLFPGRAGILLAAVSAANEDATNFGGMDIMAELTATLNLATGAYSTTASSGWSSGEASDLSQAWAILGLSAAAMPVPTIASNYLLVTQSEDGSWGYGDLDTTALAVNALLGSGNVQPHDATIQKALDYFEATQLSNGGWRPIWDSDPLNADSTGWILQALRTAGFTYPATSWASEEGDPVSALISLQKADGSIGGTYANAYSTVEAIYGLTDEALFNLGVMPRSLRALTWLNDQQNTDGSWSSPSEQSDSDVTADAVLAYLAAGYDAHTISPTTGNVSAMDYLSNTAAAFADLGPDAAGKLALAVQASGDDPRSFGGINILQVITGTYDQDNGGFGVITNTWHQAYAILGLQAAGEEAPPEAVDTLRTLQHEDGGWSYDGEPGAQESDPKSTALAMQALIAAGEAPPSLIQDAISFLHDVQDSYGGWGNASSTAFAIQGLLSAGVELTGEDWLVDEHSPFNALAAYQKADGPFYSDHSMLLLDDGDSTRLAIPALLGMHFPFIPDHLSSFTPIQLFADADRAVISLPRSTWGNSIVVTAPVGSDMNQNLELILDWRPLGSEEWISGTPVQREPGYFSAILPVDELQFYQLRLNYSDPENVQYEGIFTETFTLEAVVAPNPVFLPLVEK